MTDPNHSEPDEADRAYAFRLRAGPKAFADRLHERVRRTVEDVLEEGLDTRDEPRGWAEVGPLRPNGRRP